MTAARRLVAVALAATLAVGALGCSSEGSDGAPSDAGSGGTGGDTTTTELTGDGSPENTVPPSPGVTLPDGFPGDLAPPEVVTLVEAAEVAPGSYVVRGEVAGAQLEAVYDGLRAQLTEAGYEVVAPTFTPDDVGGGAGGLSATGPGFTVSATFGPDDTTQTPDTYVVQLSVAAVGG